VAVETDLAPATADPNAAAPSLAGPADPGTPIRLPPAPSRSRLRETMRFSFQPLNWSLEAAAELGDVWKPQFLLTNEPFVFTSHPDHVESLFKARPADAPSLTGESPLRPILGPGSVLTSVGERHMRQRKLLLPSFHGEAVQRYVHRISAAIENEIDTWPVGRPLALAPRMQAVTLEVITAGVFGIEGTPEPGSPEERMRGAVQRIGRLSTHPLWHLVELWQFGRPEPKGPLRAAMSLIDRELYAAIRARRAAGSRPGATDVFSLLLEARDEDGNALSDQEVRDELLTLVLAGHETTANSLAWTFERLVRTPAAYGRLCELVRDGSDSRDAVADAKPPARGNVGDKPRQEGLISHIGNATGDAEACADADAYVDATIYEGMRVRPVIPMIARRVKRPWRLGEYVVPEETPITVSIVALHHREDVYPDPHAFRPERFLETSPGTYTWVPFGGGIRRCLGASLAMAEQRVVLKAIARRTDLRAAKPADEPARQRNVTMIPRDGGRVVVEAKRPA
jgi:cytochrome P450